MGVRQTISCSFNEMWWIRDEVYISVIRSINISCFVDVTISMHFEVALAPSAVTAMTFSPVLSTRRIPSQIIGNNKSAVMLSVAKCARGNSNLKGNHES